jgi:hypothetical protein
MNWRFVWLAGIAGALALAPARAAQTTVVTETFDGTIDQAAWRLGTLDEIEPEGGTPGAYLRNRQLDAAVPEPVFVGALPSAFLGDYRAEGVTDLGLDVNIFSAGIGVDARRPVSLVLGSDMGTPEDPGDDCEVYLVGSKHLPKPGSGWRSFGFPVPSEETSLPQGWKVRGACAGLSQDAAWNEVITHVSRVTFPFADPDTLWFFQVWDVGIDSVRITLASGR